MKCVFLTSLPPSLPPALPPSLAALSRDWDQGYNQLLTDVVNSLELKEEAETEEGKEARGGIRRLEGIELGVEGMQGGKGESDRYIRKQE